MPSCYDNALLLYYTDDNLQFLDKPRWFRKWCVEL